MALPEDIVIKIEACLGFKKILFPMAQEVVIQPLFLVYGFFIIAHRNLDRIAIEINTIDIIESIENRTYITLNEYLVGFHVITICGVQPNLFNFSFQLIYNRL